MGIVNITPDSFSDAGQYFDPEDAIRHGIQLAEDGADILDLGAESTRPGSEPVSAREEIRRLAPVVEALHDQVEIPISIDTAKASVAEKMLHLGASMINDISGLQFDAEIGDIAAEWDCPLVLMHIQGTPRTMQENPEYTDVVEAIRKYFQERVEFAHSRGVRDEQLILDPGIGFGKTVAHNYEIFRGIPCFKQLGYPLLFGASRKSFIGKTLDLPVDDRLEGSLAAAVIAAWQGVDILRVHDVKETKRAVMLADAIRGREQVVE
ncbi:MAG TPA: dihydropteroate synthase [bacterium]|nr:dihydropteroate synthase [bacterium]